MRKSQQMEITEKDKQMQMVNNAQNQEQSSGQQAQTDVGNQEENLRWNWHKKQKNFFDDKDLQNKSSECLNKNSKEQVKEKGYLISEQLQANDPIFMQDQMPTLKEEKEQILTLKEEKEQMPKNTFKNSKKQEQEPQLKNIQAIKQDTESLKVQEKNQEIQQKIHKIQSFKSNKIHYQYSLQPQNIKHFSQINKSPTISVSSCKTQSTQMSPYYDNFKLSLTQNITSISSKINFQVSNLKYCVGFGLCLKQVVQSHNYCYQSDTNQMSHGLYIVTSQGYSWSHSEPNDDDCVRQGFQLLYNGACVEIELVGEQLNFKWKKGNFSMVVPSRMREKYTLAFCAYVHDKGDQIRIC